MKHTNEELAELIKNGELYYYSELWKQNTAFFRMICNRYYNKFVDRCTASGVAEDDLMQECFIALCCAVKAFEIKRGYKLLSYVNYHIKNRFDGLAGCRRHKPEPLNSSASLDVYLSDDSETTLGDLQADESAEQDFKAPKIKYSIQSFMKR